MNNKALVISKMKEVSEILKQVHSLVQKDIEGKTFLSFTNDDHFVYFMNTEPELHGDVNNAIEATYSRIE
jgi:hypothetical protein